MIPSLGMSLSSLSLSLSFSRQALSQIPTFVFYFKERSHRFWLVVLLDTLKYSHKPVAMVQYGIITYIKWLDTADYYPQCGRRGSYGCTSTIHHDLKSIVTRLTNKAVSPGQMYSPTNDKNCSYHRCTIQNLKKNNYQTFLTVPWGILILGEIARGMFCIIKSNYIISCNSFWINREKLGDYIKWTDYSLETPHTRRCDETRLTTSKSVKFRRVGWCTGDIISQPTFSNQVLNRVSQA